MSDDVLKKPLPGNILRRFGGSAQCRLAPGNQVLLTKAGCPESLCPTTYSKLLRELANPTWAQEGDWHARSAD
jgi:hypothetical protein